MTGAVITASVAVVVAVLTQLETWRRSRSDRAYERRRTALLDVQDAALALRRELRAYGVRLRDAASTSKAQAGSTGLVLSVVAPTIEVDEARGRLDVCAVRLEDKPPSRRTVARLTAWQEAATEHFISPADVTTSAEELAWSDLHLAVAAALAV